MTFWENLLWVVLCLILTGVWIMLSTSESGLDATPTRELPLSEQSMQRSELTETASPFRILREYQQGWFIKADSWTGVDPYTGREYPVLSFSMSPGLTPKEDLAKWKSCKVCTCETERFELDPGLWAITVSFTYGRKGRCAAEVHLGKNCLTILRERDSHFWATVYVLLRETTSPCFLRISCPEGETQYWQASVEPVYPWMSDYTEGLEKAYRF